MIEETKPDPERQKKAKALAQTRRLFSLGDFVFGAAVLLALSFSGYSVKFVLLLQIHPMAQASVYSVILMIGFTILSMPLTYFGGYKLTKRYGLTKQSLSGWLFDRLKSGALGLVFGTVMVSIVYFLLNRFPELWWVLAWVITILVSLLLSIIAPVLIVPIFFRTKPIEDGEVKARLERLAEKAGTKVRGVYAIEFGSKVTAANAALMGMGNTRRIVLSDTLLSAYTPDEIEVIMAHELGHHVHRDMFRLLIFQSAMLLIGFYIVSLVFHAGVTAFGFDRVGDPAAFPLLIIISGAFSLLASPVISSFSRFVESQADGYALTLSGNPAAFISSMTKLTDQNLSVAQPGRWEEVLFWEHPSYVRRVEKARRYTNT